MCNGIDNVFILLLRNGYGGLMTAYRQDPPPDELRNLIEYRDGEIYYLPAAKGSYTKAKGKALGFVRKDGYRNLMITCEGERRHYLAHRLGYWLVTGEWVAILDHINRNRSDNRIENLKPCEWFENCRNNTIRKDNESGYTGVTLHTDGLWRVSFSIESKRYHIDGYKHKETAALARDLLIHMFYGDFARYGISENELKINE